MLRNVGNISKGWKWKLVLLPFYLYFPSLFHVHTQVIFLPLSISSLSLSPSLLSFSLSHTHTHAHILLILLLFSISPSRSPALCIGKVECLNPWSFTSSLHLSWNKLCYIINACLTLSLLILVEKRVEEGGNESKQLIGRKRFQTIATIIQTDGIGSRVLMHHILIEIVVSSIEATDPRVFQLYSTHPSISHTHIHVQTLTPTCINTHTLPLTNTHSDSYTHMHTHTLSLTYTNPHIHTNTHTHTQIQKANNQTTTTL